MGSKRKEAKLTGKKLKAAMDTVIAELAADHSRYFDSFIATWEGATENTDNLAEAFIQHLEDHIAAVLRPYSIDTLYIYSHLIFNMTGSEEQLFAATVADNTAAWQKLCAAIPLRRPQFKGDLDGVLDHIRTLGKIFSNIFLGWTRAVLPPEYETSYTAVRKTLDKIRKEGLA